MPSPRVLAAPLDEPPRDRLTRWRQIFVAALAGIGALTLSTPSAQAQGLIRDAEIERTLGMMTEPLFRAANLNPRTIEIFILNDRSLNAFVDAGRNMFIHTGMLVGMETPEQLMGVMAHETGHITGGHILRRIEAFENARIQAIVTQLIGIGAAAAGGGQAGLGLAGAGSHIAQRELLRFTRGQESSADQAALAIMNAAGVDPTGMLQVLEKLSAEQAVFLTGVDPYALTHPLSTSRIRALSLGVSRSPVLGRTVSKDLAYWHARMRAKLDGFLTTPGTRVSTTFDNPEMSLYREAIRLHRLPAPDQALAAIDKLIGMRPNDPYYWELKGQILHESGRGAAAIEPYRRAVGLAPESGLIRAGLGEALLAAGNPASDREALSMLEQAALEEPFDAGLRRALAIAYARKGDDGMAAVVTAERLALTGRVSDAKRQAERAKALLPTGSPGWLRADDVSALKAPN